MFADFEAATAASAMAALANCAADIGGYSGVPGIFDAAYADALGIAGAAPVLTIVSAHAPEAAYGDAVAVNGDSYTVARVEPDGTGMLRLILETA